MIKLFISDLDGTLIHKPKLGIEPNKENTEAVKLLKKNNIDFAIATGRYDYHILEIEKYINSKNYRIGLNGGTIYTKDNILIRENTFDYEEVLKLKEYIENNHMKNINYLVMLSSEVNRYIKYPNFFKKLMNFRHYQKKFNAVNCSNDIFKKLKEKNEKIIKFLVNSEFEKKYILQDEFRKKYPELEITISGPKSIEIGPNGNTKGNAIKLIMEKENLKRNEIAFIGDSYNDISGFEVCDYSFAMSHADDYIKDRAEFVVESVSDAVKKVIELNKS